MYTVLVDPLDASADGFATRVARQAERRRLERHLRAHYRPVPFTLPK